MTHRITPLVLSLLEAVERGADDSKIKKTVFQTSSTEQLNEDEIKKAISSLNSISKRAQKQLLVETESKVVDLLDRGLFDEAVNIVHTVPGGECRAALWLHISRYVVSQEKT
jgi:hypothetical protein